MTTGWAFRGVSVNASQISVPVAYAVVEGTEGPLIVGASEAHTRDDRRTLRGGGVRPGPRHMRSRPRTELPAWRQRVSSPRSSQCNADDPSRAVPGLQPHARG